MTETIPDPFRSSSSSRNDQITVPANVEVSQRSMRHSEHVHIVTKWRPTMNLTKSQVRILQALTKRWYHRLVCYEMDSIYTKSEVKD